MWSWKKRRLVVVGTWDGLCLRMALTYSSFVVFAELLKIVIYCNVHGNESLHTPWIIKVWSNYTTLDQIRICHFLEQSGNHESCSFMLKEGTSHPSSLLHVIAALNMIEIVLCHCATALVGRYFSMFLQVAILQRTKAVFPYCETRFGATWLATTLIQ